jgi:long-chain acyl-CoA synthetase
MERLDCLPQVGVPVGSSPLPARTVRDLIDRMAAIRGDAPFLIAPDSGRVVTFLGLQAHARALAAQLAGWGLAKGDRVAFLLDNGLFTAQLLLGTAYAGFVPVPISVQGGPGLVASIVAHADPRAVFVSPDHERLLEAPMGGPVRIVRAHPDDGPEWDVTPLPTVPLPEVGPEDDALVAYTSGTTGRPRGALFSHAARVAGSGRAVRAWGLGPGDRALCVLPLHHNNARNAMLLPTLASGGSVVMPRRFDVDAFWDLMVRHRCTWAALVPTLVARLLSRPDPPGGAGALAHVRFLRSSAAPLAPALHGAFESRFGVPLLQGMGATEVGSVIFTNPLPPAARKAGSAGRPAPGVEVRIVDDAGQVLPAGQAGALLVRAPGIMKGYYKDPGATVEVLDAHGWLRTEDVGYLDEEGFFFVVGRSAEFIKKGGVKINLREVDEALARHPAVLEAAAVGVPDPYLGEDLVAFVVPRPGASIAPGDLAAFCEGGLGAFKVPVRIEIVASLPRGAAGKLARSRLLDAAGSTPVPNAPLEPRPLAAPVAAGGPSTRLETLVAETWAEVLGVNGIGAHDDFFALGGHSLLGARAVARLRGALDVEIPLRFLFEAPTVAEFAARVQDLRAGPGPSPAPAPAPRAGPAPLSPAQARMWPHCQGTGARGYIVNHAFDVKGPLDVGALARSLSEIVRRHEILRTTYAVVNGEPVQIVRPAGPAPLTVIDARPSPAGGGAQGAAAHELDLAAGPVMRAVLTRFGGTEHRLCLQVHHLAGDRRSAEILCTELGALYGAFARGGASPLPELPLQYGDYAVWHRRRLTPCGEVSRRQLAYWVGRLAAPPAPLTLPFPRRRARAARPEEGTETVPYPEEFRQCVEALGRRERVSPFMILLAALAALLHHATGQRDVMVGTYTSLRTWPQLDPLIGLFVNLVVLRLAVDPARTFRELLAGTRATTLEAFENSDVAFETVLYGLRDAGCPVPGIEVIVVYASHRGKGSLTLPGLEVTPVFLPELGAPRFPWGLTVEAADEGAFRAAFDPRRYAPAGVRWLLAELVALLERATADPALRVADLAPGTPPPGEGPPWLRRVFRRWSGA